MSIRSQEAIACAKASLARRMADRRRELIARPLAEIWEELAAVAMDGSDHAPQGKTSATVLADAVKRALEFYADPFAWKEKNDPDNDVPVPDFYSETNFGDFARTVLDGMSRSAASTIKPVAWHWPQEGLVTTSQEAAELWRNAGMEVRELVYAAPTTSPEPDAVRIALEAARQAIEYSIDMGGTDPAGVLLQALNKAEAALSRPAHGGCNLALGDLVEMQPDSPYAPDWMGATMKVVSLRVDPEGRHWVSVIEGDQRHRGNGVYDGETTDVEADHLQRVTISRNDRGSPSA